MSTTKTSSSKTATTHPVAEGLKVLLAESYALMAQTHLAHWNVEGAHFFSLHTAFQKQYEELFEAVDEIAERLRALDFYAPGGLKGLAQISKIDEIGTGAAPAKDFVAHLIESHERVLASAQALRDVAADGEDLETQDLAIKRGQFHQKTLWMLRSFLKNL
jgi:starvation-inducible DNA-binding protein